MLRTTTRAATSLLRPSSSFHHGVKHSAIRWSSGRAPWRLTSQATALLTMGPSTTLVPTKSNLRSPEKHQRDLYTSTGTGLFSQAASAGSGGETLLLMGSTAGWASIVAVGMSGGY